MSSCFFGVWADKEIKCLLNTYDHFCLTKVCIIPLLKKSLHNTRFHLQGGLLFCWTQVPDLLKILSMLAFWQSFTFGIIF